MCAHRDLPEEMHGCAFVVGFVRKEAFPQNQQTAQKSELPYHKFFRRAYAFQEQEHNNFRSHQALPVALPFRGQCRGGHDGLQDVRQVFPTTLMFRM